MDLGWSGEAPERCLHKTWGSGKLQPNTKVRQAKDRSVPRFVTHTQGTSVQAVHIHVPLARSKLHVPLVQSLSSRQVSLGVWQKYP